MKKAQAKKTVTLATLGVLVASVFLGASHAAIPAVATVSSKDTPKFIQALLREFSPVSREGLDIRLSRGTESGGGGSWVEIQFFKGAHRIVEKLGKKNPQGIDLQEFTNLIDNTTLVLSDKPLYLNGQRKNAINFFPDHLVILLEAEAWKTLFEQDRDVDSLIYHEFLPYFKGNDFQYKLSRAEQFNLPRPLSIRNIRSGHYVPYLKPENSCIIAVDVDPDLGLIRVRWTQNPASPISCGSSAEIGDFQCPTESPTNCVAERFPEHWTTVLSPGGKLGRVRFGAHELRLNFRSETELEWGYFKADPDDTTFVTAGPETFTAVPTRESVVVSRLSEMSWSKAPGATYGQNCRKAAHAATDKAMQKCAKLGSKCIPIKQEPYLLGSSSGETGCAIRSTVEIMP
ncbi:MAG: hypothetical protein NDJ89_15785 [Oligoflexia bacterium]|nr:hypothetical protein [Oligoflexia bacterium]